jgi:hypothetical protein
MTGEAVLDVSHSQSDVDENDEDHQLPPMPRYSALSLSLPNSNRESSVGLSSQSMRTSSFAMSDISESKLPQQLESLRIRRAYTRPSRSRKSNIESIAETNDVDYHDESDFQNTDRLLLSV